MTDSDSILAFVALATTLNFVVLTRLWRNVRSGQDDRPELMFPAGIELEPFTGIDRDNRQIDICSASGTAYVFVFLSQGCPKCRAAVPAVMDVAARMDGLDLDLWIVTAEQLVGADLGQGAVFDAYVLDLPRISYAMLNPRRASPSYLFVGGELVVEAGGFVGDDNWESFVTQMGEQP